MVKGREGSNELLSIGEVSSVTAVAVSAIRYYDEIGLIAAVSRVGGKRRFAPEVVGRISFIRRAKDAGFSLDDIGNILDDTSGEWRSLVAAKRLELAERRKRLDELIGMLDEIGECGCSVVVNCPMWEPVAS